MNMDLYTRTREKSEFLMAEFGEFWQENDGKIADFLSKMDKDFIDFH